MGLQPHNVVRSGIVLGLIVLSSPGAVDAQLTLTVADQPTTVIGRSNAPGHELIYVRSGGVLDDGSIAILNVGTHDIRFFDRDGGLLSTLGRQGQGPGEFLNPRSARFFPNGAVIVADIGSQRMTSFDETGSVVDEQRIHFHEGERVPLRSWDPPLENGLLPMATLDVSLFESVRREEGLYEDTVVIDIFDDGNVRTSLRYPRGVAFHAREAQRGLTRPVPFSDAILYSWGPDRVVVGTTHGRIFDAFDPDGERLEAFEAQGEVGRVEEADWLGYQRALRQELDDPIRIRGRQVGGAPVDRFLAETPRSAERPLFDDIYVDDLARLWLREFGYASDGDTWQVVTLDRESVDRVELPAGSRVLAAGEEWVLVLQKDGLDVEYVSLYEVRRIR